jgi:hypothetical protein
LRLRFGPRGPCFEPAYDPWLVNPRRDYRGFIRAWRDYFPDPAKAPALAYVPATATMYPGPLIEIDPTCVARG